MIQREGFAKPGPDEVTLDLTAHLQGIALRGWQAALPHRSEHELRHQFNPDNRQHLEEVQEVYVAHAQAGGLVLAYTLSSADPVGFALAKEDVSGNATAQEFKRRYRPEKVYAWLRHVCVDPPYQGHGRGGALVATALEAFRLDQIPTAYIFAENQPAIDAASKLGFRMTPMEQEPKVDSVYFGHGQPPVAQYRFAGASVESVLQKVRTRRRDRLT